MTVKSSILRWPVVLILCDADVSSGQTKQLARKRSTNWMGVCMTALEGVGVWVFWTPVCETASTQINTSVGLHSAYLWALGISATESAVRQQLIFARVCVSVVRGLCVSY